MSRRTSFKHLMKPCQNDHALHAWVKAHLGLDIPTTPVCPHHDAPFEYLRRSYFEPGNDLVVWAPRGGGKTRLGAVATLLDLLHKPGVSVRILGGSVEQSLKMWEHLLPDVERWAEEQIAGRVRARRVRLRNGSLAAVLTQSQRAVRGLRVQKLRCDEVELFDEQVWEAAQLVTRSMKMQGVAGKTGGEAGRNACSASASQVEAGEGVIVARKSFDPTIVAGTVEALSTLHAPYGLMSRVIESAAERGTPIVSWCVLDVLERCPPTRECATCPLWEDCQGVAKTKCNGFVRIDDAIALKSRVGSDTWQSEMLCRRPSVRQCVFPMFDVGKHVRAELPIADFGLPIEERPFGSFGFRSIRSPQSHIRNSPPISLAIDFGFSNPFVCLWIATRDGVTHVIDEYIQPGQTIDEHIPQLARRSWGWSPARGTVVCCDPAGRGRSDQTGRSSIDALRAAGYVVKSRATRIVDGLDRIRAALHPATGEPKLYVHPRCQRLIKALRSYRYPDGGGELPIKDGVFDHPIDALRYHFMNHGFMSGKLIIRRY